MKRYHTRQILFWGIMLGAVFGAGMAMGASGGWELLSSASLPLLREERLDYLRWMLNPLLIGIGMAIGVGWGAFCGVITALGKRTTFILIAIILVWNIIDVILNPKYGSALFLTTIFGLPTLVGYGLLQIYLRFKHLTLFVPLVLVGGFLFGYFPWTMNGRDNYRALVRTEAYAQKHNITDYQISVTQAESGGYRTRIHLQDGSILYCYSWPYDSEFKECTPTPQ